MSCVALPPLCSESLPNEVIPDAVSVLGLVLGARWCRDITPPQAWSEPVSALFEWIVSGS